MHLQLYLFVNWTISALFSSRLPQKSPASHPIGKAMFFWSDPRCFGVLDKFQHNLFLVTMFFQVGFRFQYQLINLAWLSFDFFLFSWSLDICFLVCAVVKKYHKTSFVNSSHFDTAQEILLIIIIIFCFIFYYLATMSPFG